MKVEVSHHIDSSEADANGMYDYRYEYDVFSFSDGGIKLTARSYRDETEAQFLSIEIEGASRSIDRADLNLSVFVSAVEYLRNIGKIQINWLSGKGNGYEPIPAFR